MSISVLRARDSNRLDGVRVAITGGTSGLGLALVRELLRRGARVAFVARTASASKPSRARIPGATASSATSRGRKTSHPIALQIAGNLGGLDVLVNNASSLGPVPLALLADTECEDLELALATNVLGPFRLTKALLGALAASAREGRGSVVLNVSSDAAVNAVSAVGRLRREQGGAASHEPHLGRGARGRRRPRSVARSRATWTRRCTRWRCRTPTRRRSSGRRPPRASSPMRSRSAARRAVTDG